MSALITSRPIRVVVDAADRSRSRAMSVVEGSEEVERPPRRTPTLWASCRRWFSMYHATVGSRMAGDLTEKRLSDRTRRWYSSEYHRREGVNPPVSGGNPPPWNAQACSLVRVLVPALAGMVGRALQCPCEQSRRSHLRTTIYSGNHPGRESQGQTQKPC